MNTTTKLSVSSVILAAVLSGCSQQQVIGGSQVSGPGLSGGGSQQVAGGSQVSGGSQQQIESAVPVVIPHVVAPVRRAPIRRAPVRVARPQPVRSVKRGLGLPAAQPGQCFAKVKVPAAYQTKSRRVLIQKATATRKLVRAPQYRWINKKVLVRKPSYRTRVIPAQYRTVNKRVLVKPAYNTWRPGHVAITRIDNMTGQIMCRVKIPAVYKNVQHRVLVRKAQQIRTLIPAQYKTVKQKQFVAPAQYRTVRTPARYKTQNYRVQTRSARYEWRSIICKTNAPKRAYKKHYTPAPKKHVKRAVVKRKPVVRTAHKKQYRPRTVNNQGINYQDFLKVMRAGSGKAKANPAKKKYKKAVLKPRTKKVTKPYKVKTKKAVMKKKVTEKKTVMKKPVVSKKAVTKKPAAVTKKPATETQSKASSKKSIVFGIQKALKEKGFDPGTMDGKMGPGTAAALKAFQSSRGLPIGQLSKDTFRALGLIR